MADTTERSTPAPALPRTLTANLSAEHQERVARIVARTGLVTQRRLSIESKVLFVVSALCADANGNGSADAVKVALSDPAVLTVACSIIAQAVAR
ncbi:hypothetical protein BH09ACT8_BH09ACT8_30930 [soil metagenome]